MQRPGLDLLRSRGIRIKTGSEDVGEVCSEHTRYPRKAVLLGLAL